MLVVEGTIQKPTACYIMAEGIPVVKGHLRNCVSLLIASFYVFNMQCPPRLGHFYTILEILLLKQVPKNVALLFQSSCLYWTTNFNNFGVTLVDCCFFCYVYAFLGLYLLLFGPVFPVLFCAVFGVFCFVQCFSTSALKLKSLIQNTCH